MNSGTIWGRFVEKNQRKKISCYCPFKSLYCFDPDQKYSLMQVPPVALPLILLMAARPGVNGRL